MNKGECAEELYNLIAVRGRWKGDRSRGLSNNGSYSGLPEWVKELWEAKAVEFAQDNGFKLDS